MSENQGQVKYCPVSVTQNVLMGKWKLAILWILSHRTRRFNELQRLIPKVSRGVFTQQLRATAKCNMDICISNKFSCYKCYEMMQAGVTGQEHEV